MSETRDDFVEITQAVKTYVEGMVEADETKLRAAFHKDACCIGHYEGGLEWDSLDKFIAGVKAAVATPDRNPYWHLHSIAVTGDTAVARVEDDWLGMRFDDTLTLLRHDGKWVIVSKLFFHRTDT